MPAGGTIAAHCLGWRYRHISFAGRLRKRYTTCRRGEIAAAGSFGGRLGILK
jgi:hypothetical protein